MPNRTTRVTTDPAQYPDLVVIYLGMRINDFRGILTLLSFGWQVGMAMREKPEGLLHSETFMFSIRQIGLRQYWSDLDSLEAWARTSVHKGWWKGFLANPGGTGFWHEVYSMRHGMEGMYVSMEVPVGFMNFTPVVPARGTRFSARSRLDRSGEAVAPVPVTEDELYVDSGPGSQAGPKA